MSDVRNVIRLNDYELDNLYSLFVGLQKFNNGYHDTGDWFLQIIHKLEELDACSNDANQTPDYHACPEFKELSAFRLAVSLALCPIGETARELSINEAILGISKLRNFIDETDPV